VAPVINRSTAAPAHPSGIWVVSACFNEAAGIGAFIEAFSAKRDPKQKLHSTRIEKEKHDE